MSHHPLTLIGLLPFVDGLGCIDVNIIYIAHVEAMKSDFHASSITDLSLISDKFGRHGKDLSDHFGAGPCHLHVFSLCAMSGSELDKMYP